MATTIDPAVAKQEFSEYLDMVASVQKAEEYAAKLTTPGNDGKGGELENVTVVTRMRYNDGTSTLIHTSEDMDKYIALFIQNNEYEVFQRALLEAAIALNKEKQEAEDAMLAAGLTPGTVSAPGTPTITATEFTRVGHINHPFTFQIPVDPAPAGQALSFMAYPLPAGLVMDSATGIISGTPLQVGSMVTHVKVQNTTNLLYALAEFTISIGQALPPPPPANPPVITSSLAESATVGTAYTYTVTGTDFDAAVVIEATGLPSSLTLNGATISGTPVSGDVGTHNITLTATNPDAQVDTQTLVLTVA